MKVIFMGTPDFSVGTLEALAEAGHEVVRIRSDKNERRKSDYRTLWRDICRIYLHRIMGEQAICSNFRSDRSSGFPWFGTGKTYQTGFFPTGTPPMAESENIQSDFRCGRNEDEYGTGLRSCHFQRADRRRSFLERM